jgi:uncharacterized protein YdaU (DUF1376 family)
MHHYTHHIGDYAEATSHLSILEDGVYSRLLRKYYARERPLPADVAEVQRLCVARTKAERAAVVRILAEFFTLEDDGYHQDRADDVIADYQEGEPDRELRKANMTTRSKRHRDERAQLFEVVRAAGVHLAWNIGIADLRAAAARCTTPSPGGSSGGPGEPPDEPAGESSDGPPRTPPVTPPATAPVTPVTANQEPGTENQEPVPPRTAGEPPAPTPGEACKAMRIAGLADVNPSHPRLLGLLQAGITLDELTSAAQHAADRQKPFAYALSTAEGRRNDAARAPALQPRRRATSHTDVDNQQFSEGMDANGTLA